MEDDATETSGIANTEAQSATPTSFGGMLLHPTLWMLGLLIAVVALPSGIAETVDRWSWDPIGTGLPEPEITRREIAGYVVGVGGVALAWYGIRGLWRGRRRDA